MSKSTDASASPASVPASRERARLELRSGFRRSLGLTALGTALPGAGLTQTRSRVFGWVLFGLAMLTVIVLGTIVITRGPADTALSIVSRPQTLQVITVAFVVMGVLWCASIVMTAVQARPRRLDATRSRVLAAFTTLMVLVVAGSSFKAAEYAAITKDTVQQVFGSSPDQDVAGGGTGETGGAHIAEGSDPWAETPRVNILLLGSDAGVGRDGTRTDSMIVASIDTKTGRTALISLPRNLERVPLPVGSPLRQAYPSGIYGSPVCQRGAHECLLNAIWMEVVQFRKDHPDSYPGLAVPGRYETRNVISEVTGLHIDHTVVIDLKGFQQLIDAMGGIKVNVKLSGYGAKLPIGGHADGNGNISGVTGYFEPGLQHLDGFHALWYARTRAADDDFYRQARQRCVVQAIVAQVNPSSMVAKYPDLAKIAKDNIYTDIPAANLPAYVDLVERVKAAKITSVVLSAKTGVQSGDPDYALIRKLVQNGITPPTSTPSPSGSSPSTPSPKPEKTPSSSPPTTSYDAC